MVKSKIIEKMSISGEQWSRISSRIRAVFNFGIEKSEWLMSCRIAKFIAAIPFLAGCEKAEETAFSNLSIYILSTNESSKDIYFHKPSDNSDIYSRLKPISHFNGGDEKTIQCCLDLIALNMISNYKKDAEYDRTIGKYNPVADGSWNYYSISSKLIKSINKKITAGITELYTIEEASKGYWQG